MIVASITWGQLWGHLVKDESLNRFKYKELQSLFGSPRPTNFMSIESKAFKMR